MDRLKEGVVVPLALRRIDLGRLDSALSRFVTKLSACRERELRASWAAVSAEVERMLEDAIADGADERRLRELMEELGVALELHLLWQEAAAAFIDEVRTYVATRAPRH